MPEVILTARAESERDSTIEDLKATGLDYLRLVMNGSDAPAPEFKANEVKNLIEEGMDPDVFIDNDPANREAVAALGVDVVDPADLNAESEDLKNENVSSKVLVVDRLSKIKMTIEDQLSTADLLAQALTAERDDLRATVEKLTVGAADELSAIKADLVTKEASLSALGVSLEKATAERDAFAAKIAELEATKVTASKEAAKIAASVGVEPTAIIPGSDNVAAKVDALATFNSLTDPVAKADFFAKNAQAIYASIKV